jgi:hypothetical protein
VSTHTVQAKRWARGWELHSFEFDIRPDLGDGVAAEVGQARRATREAEQAQKDAARRWW